MTGEIIAFPPKPKHPCQPREALARDLIMALRPGATVPEVVNILRGKWSGLTAAEIHSGIACLHKLVALVHQLMLIEFGFASDLDLGLDSGADEGGGDGDGGGAA
jgi:hypothetical protein